MTTHSNLTQEEKNAWLRTMVGFWKHPTNHQYIELVEVSPDVFNWRWGNMPDSPSLSEYYTGWRGTATNHPNVFGALYDIAACNYQKIPDPRLKIEDELFTIGKAPLVIWMENS